MFQLLWSKTVGYIVGGIGIMLALAGLRYRIRSTARADMQNQMRERTLERIEQAQRVDQNVDHLDDDGILTRLREQGWIRD